MTASNVVNQGGDGFSPNKSQQQSTKKRRKELAKVRNWI